MPTETIFCHVIKTFFPANVVDKLCPERITTVGKCWSCRSEISFVVPRRGYSNGSGRCPSCGLEYTMLTNYGLITLFPPGVVEEYAEIRSQVGDLNERN